MDSTIIFVALGAVTAGFVQGLSGFAFGLVAMSFWAWTLEPQLAGVMAVFGALIGQIVAALTVRRGLEWKLLLPFITGGLIGIPVGIKIIPYLNPQLFKACLGTLLVIWCPCMLIVDRLPRIRIGGSFADGIVGAIGGMMGGIGGFSGTIPTLWCTLRGFDKDTQRCVIQNFNLAMLSSVMAAYVFTGAIHSAMFPMFSIVAAAMLVPTIFGIKVYVGITEATFRKLVLSLLMVSGAALLASSLPKLLFQHG